MATLDVTDYGAVGDGSSDDTRAIQSAINDASSGDTVYFPATSAYYGIRGSQTILTIRGIDNLTVAGDGEGSEVRYIGGNGGSNVMQWRLEGLNGFEMRDMILHGGRSNVSGSPTFTTIVWTLQNNPGSQSYTFEDCVVRDSWMTGAHMQTNNVTVNRCSFVDNGGHGLTFDVEGLAGERNEVYSTLFEGNAHRDTGHYGTDAAYGNFLYEDCVFSGNTRHVKTVRHDTGTFRNVRMSGASIMPFMTTNSDNRGSGTIYFEDIVVENNNGTFRLEDEQHIEVPDGREFVITGSNPSTDGQLYFLNNVTADISTLHSSYSSQSGIGSSTNGSVTIDNYYHHANSGGAIGPSANLTIGTQSDRLKTDIDHVPTADEVGAWTGDDDPQSDEPEEEDEEEWRVGSRANHLTSDGGVIQTNSGTIISASSGPPSAPVIEGFESYPSGTELVSTSHWAGAGIYDTNYVVTDDAAADGEQSLVLAESGWYNAIQSMPGDGLETYPETDCTIRIASYMEDGSLDIGFGIPEGETNYDQNCYRIIGGPGSSERPQVTRTVDYSMETLATLDNEFPSNTWVDHVIEFESTGSEVAITYTGYAWHQSDSEWVRFESGTEATDSDSTFADGSGIGLGGFQAGTDGIRFDELRVGKPGAVGPPTWTPVTENP